MARFGIRPKLPVHPEQRAELLDLLQTGFFSLTRERPFSPKKPSPLAGVKNRLIVQSRSGGESNNEPARTHSVQFWKHGETSGPVAVVEATNPRDLGIQCWPAADGRIIPR